MKRGKNLPLVSIIIPHYGGTKILCECLKSLENVIYPNIEIILVDNNSPDDSIEIIQKKFSKIKLIKSNNNLGYAGGCNLGAQNANGKYLLIINNDTIHEINWINKLIDLMESNNNISSVQPKIKNYYNKNYFDYAGASGGFIDKYGFPFVGKIWIPHVTVASIKKINSDHLFIKNFLMNCSPKFY